MKPFILLLLLGTIICNHSFGCMCATGSNIKKSYHKAEIVVSVVVIAVKDLSETKTTANGQSTIILKAPEYKAIVYKQYKGDKTSDTIAIDPGFGSCQMPFSLGKKYIIFASKDNNNTYGTGMCTGNIVYNEKDHKRLLKYQRRSKNDQ